MNSILGFTCRNICRSLNKILPYHQVRNAGHAKWQNIKTVKSATDLAKGQLISRYVQSVRKAIVANKMQCEPRLNKQLADVLSAASKQNVPKATLERAIARAANVKIKSFNIEIKGPGGCALIVRCETDNIPICRREMKKVLRKFENCALMQDDTLINMFRSQGFIRAATKTIDGREVDQDFAEEAAIEANAQEVNLETIGDTKDQDSSTWVFSTDAQTMEACRSQLEKHGIKVISSDLDLVPYRDIEFDDDTIEKIAKLESALRELDQVVNVYHNAISHGSKDSNC